MWSQDGLRKGLQSKELNHNLLTPSKYDCKERKLKEVGVFNVIWVETRVSCLGSTAKSHQFEDLRSLSTDAAGELDILGHDSHTLGVDSTQVGIFEKTNQVSLSSFLEGQHGRALESKIGLEILGDLTHKTLEGQLADEKVGGLLVTTDLTESDRSGTVTMRLLDSTGGGGRLTGSLGGELLTGSLSSGGFTCGLLSTCHLES